MHKTEQARQNFTLLYNNKDTKGQGLYRGVVVTRRLALQEFKKRNVNLTLLIIRLLTCIVLKNHIMNSCTSNNYCYRVLAI